MSLNKDYKNWLKTVSEETFIDVYLKSGCDSGYANAILWNIFLDSTHDVKDDNGYWIVDTGNTQFFFPPFENCDAMTGRAYCNLIERLIRCVFTNTYQPVAAEWLKHHATTVIEGSSKEVDIRDKAKVYNAALEDFFVYQFENDPPIPGKSYYSARWVWED